MDKWNDKQEQANSLLQDTTSHTPYMFVPYFNILSEVVSEITLMQIEYEILKEWTNKGNDKHRRLMVSYAVQIVILNAV